MAQLTAKELSALSDQLDAEKLAISKLKMYASGTQDQELKTRFEAIAAKHCQHFDKLYSLLG